MHRYDLLKMTRLDCKVQGREVSGNDIIEHVAMI